MDKETRQFIIDSQGTKHVIEGGVAKSKQRFVESGAVLRKETEQFIIDSREIKHVIEGGVAKSTQRFVESGAVLRKEDLQFGPFEKGSALVTGKGKFIIIGDVYGTLDPRLPNHPLLLIRDEQGEHFLFDRGGPVTGIAGKEEAGRILRTASDPEMIPVKLEG